MDALFYGTENDAFFDFTSVSKNRRIKYPMLPDKIAAKINGAQQVRIKPKQRGEVRILSADIALMSSKRHNNDATALFLNQMLPTKAGRYISNITYADSYEGLRTDDQALIIRKMFDEFECDYLVLDTNGIGLGIFDALTKDISDPDTGEMYPAISCCNNNEMASRCAVPGAARVIWSVKASAQFNSDCAFLLRDAFKNGRIRLLVTEYDGEDLLGEIRGYKSLAPSAKADLMLPYIQTTLLIDELTKLRHEERDGKVRISERSGMRKDRYSSLSYNYYVAAQLENKLRRKLQSSELTSDAFIIKAPSYKKTRRKAVSGYGKSTSRFPF